MPFRLKKEYQNGSQVSLNFYFILAFQFQEFHMSLPKFLGLYVDYGSKILRSWISHEISHLLQELLEDKNPVLFYKFILITDKWNFYQSS